MISGPRRGPHSRSIAIDGAARPRLPEAVRLSLVHHRHLARLVAAYLLGGFLLLAWFVPEELPEPLLNAASFAFYSAIPLAGVVAIWTAILLARDRPVRPFHHVGSALKRELAAPEALARAIPGFFLLPLMIGLFVTLKAAIPTIQPFHLDPMFIEWDLRLHGDVHPWEWLQPILGYPAATILLDQVYYLWFPVLYLTFYWQLLTNRRPELRLQFIIAFFACWIMIGSFAALALSSAGPCFLAVLSGEPTPYDGLMTYLWDINNTYEPLTALQVQHVLWSAHEGSATAAFEGISAMPSMHVSIAFLLALFGWRVGTAAGLAYSAFAALIFIGSIHLGFHYAVDGYVAVVMTVVVWWMAGIVTRRACLREAGRRLRG